MNRIHRLTTLAFAATISSTLGSSSAIAENLVVPGQFASIQAAVDAAQPGDSVILKGGTFTENVVIDGKTDLTLKAKGGAKIEPASDGFGLLALNSAKIKLLGLEMEGSADTSIQIEGCVDVLVDGCSIRDSGFDAILAVFSTRVVVRNNELSDMVGSAIALIGFGGDVSNNRIERSERHGIFVSGPGYSIQDNEVSDTALEGMEARAFGNDVHGRLLVSDNRLDRTLGMRVSGFAGVNLLSNDISDSAGEGILILKSSEVMVSENKIKGTAGNGIDLNVSANIIANKISKAGLNGLRLRIEAGGSLLKGNKISKSGATGMLVDADGAMVLDNKSSKNVGVDFKAASGDVFLIGNKFPNPAQ